MHPPGRSHHIGGDLSRRRFLHTTAALAPSSGLAGSGFRTSAAAVEPPQILPRSTWGDGLEPAGPIEIEDVRFLLVHHTGIPDSQYEEVDVIGLLREIHAFHTGPDKRWPDTAYNFYVDQFGRIFEARTGSLAGPVAGSATGGNQGFSQLCCFLGDLSENGPTVAAHDSMAWLLAWLAHRYGIDISPGARTTFVSRGSNKWAEGTTVDTATIAGHRDMSITSCPGDAGYAAIGASLVPAAASRQTLASKIPPTTPPTTTSKPSGTTPTSGLVTTSAEAAASGAGESGVSPMPGASDSQSPFVWALPLGGGAALLAAAGAIAIRQRRL